MSDLVLNAIAGVINLLPITRLQLYKYASGERIIIDQIETESSYKITPITRLADSGLAKVLGYNYEITIYVPFNLFDSNGLLEAIENLKNEENVITYLTIGGGGSYVPPEPPKTINCTAQQILAISHTKPYAELESVELRPRTIIHINGFTKQLNNF